MTDSPDLYRVFVDSQGVAYLRTSFMPPNFQCFALNIGSSVEIIKMDSKTVKTRGLTAVDFDVQEAAKKLLLPLSKSVTISPRVETILKDIIDNKELTEMAKAKKSAATKPATKSAAKASTKKSTGSKKEVVRRSANPTIKLVKSPKDGELKGQALEITNILKDAGKKLSKTDLIEKIGKKIPSKNVLGAKDIWAMNRKKLMDAGFVEEVPEAA